MALQIDDFNAFGDVGLSRWRDSIDAPAFHNDHMIFDHVAVGDIKDSRPFDHHVLRGNLKWGKRQT